MQLILDIGVKNDIRAAILKGQNNDNFDRKYTPEVIVNAIVPKISINVTPDVYNGLVNINEIIKS